MTICPVVDPVLSMALFVSNTQRSSDPDDATVRATVSDTLRRLGADECYARAAAEFGDHPDEAFDRIQWARHLCERAMAPLAAAH